MMKDKYNKILDQFELNYSKYFGRAVDWWPSGRLCITVKLSNDQLIEYDPTDNTIRYINTDVCVDDASILRGAIGRNIQKFVTTSGIPQSEIASRCGITQAMLSRYIHGNSLPGLDKLYMLSRVLGCRISDLTGELNDE